MWIEGTSTLIKEIFKALGFERPNSVILRTSGKRNERLCMPTGWKKLPWMNLKYSDVGGVTTSTHLIGLSRSIKPICPQERQRILRTLKHIVNMANKGRMVEFSGTSNHVENLLHWDDPNLELMLPSVFRSTGWCARTLIDI